MGDASAAPGNFIQGGCMMPRSDQKSRSKQESSNLVAFKGLLSFAALLATAMIVGCGMAPEKVIIQRMRSEEMNLDAIVFSLDSGATTPTAYHIAIVRASEEPSENRSIMILDRVGEPEAIKLQWVHTTLYTQTPAKARVFKELSTFDLDGKSIAVVNIRYPTQ